MRQEVIEIYKSYGIDVNKVINELKNVKISLHCWQLDDVNGFENVGALTGGIQTTGNYPGKARNFEELTEDLEFALNCIPGSKKINIHANYQVQDIVDIKDITPHQFEPWVNFAKKHNLGLDFNPTLFSSPMLVDNMSLSSPSEEVRNYWIEHCINSLKITEYFAKELNQKSLMNIWIPDGLKDVPANRMRPRERLKDSTEDFLSVLIGSDLQIISQAIFDGRKLFDKDMSFDNGFIDILGVLDTYIKLLDEHGKNPPVKLCNPETQQAEYIGNIDTKVPFLAKELIESVKVQAASKK